MDLSRKFWRKFWRKLCGKVQKNTISLKSLTCKLRRLAFILSTQYDTWTYLQSVEKSFRNLSGLPIGRLPYPPGDYIEASRQCIMKLLSPEELKSLTGDYFAPTGLYEHTKRLPFLGMLQCNTNTLTTGQWTELLVEYTVGACGLADGAWIQGTFIFYSDCALY